MDIVYNKNGIPFDIDALATDVNGKADKDLVNVSSNVSVCIESGHDENGNWYRIYSDGWCEQGGIVSWSSNPTLTINLLKAYTNTNYNVFTNCYGTYQNQYPNAIAVNNKTTSTFELRPFTDNRTANWYACGYIR